MRVTNVHHQCMYMDVSPPTNPNYMLKSCSKYNVWNTCTCFFYIYNGERAVWWSALHAYYL